jgi:hypothetical protein
LENLVALSLDYLKLTRKAKVRSFEFGEFRKQRTSFSGVRPKKSQVADPFL